MEKIIIDTDLTGVMYGATSFPQNFLRVKPLTASFNIKWNHRRKTQMLIFFIKMHHLKNNEQTNKKPLFNKQQTNDSEEINIKHSITLYPCYTNLHAVSPPSSTRLCPVI